METSQRVGRYDIVAPLADGGMSSLFLAALRGPLGFSRPVVIKTIRGGQKAGALADMFADEAQIVANIRHPNVVECFELGRDDNGLFLVMEFLAGESVGGLTRRLSRRKETLDPVLAAYIIAQVCAGLHAAHELVSSGGVSRKLVHRDVSPQNIIVSYDGSVKLIDFGIAKAEDRITETEAGMLKGKFAYMSPEQARAEPLDRRSDLFSLGVVLWELSTGRHLFQLRNSVATLRAVCEKKIPDPESVVPGFPPELARIVLRALKRNRKERYSTAAEMRRELLGFVEARETAELPEETLAKLMSRLFPKRIIAKRDMLRQVEQGKVPDRVVDPDVDIEIELPTVAVTSGPRTDPGAFGKRFWVPGLVLALAAGVLGSVIWGEGVLRDPASEAGPATQRDAPPAKRASAPIERVAPVQEVSNERSRRVVITVETIPSAAEVWFDGERKGTTPVAVEVDRTDEVLKARLVRRGFQPLNFEITPSEDQQFQQRLRRIRPQGPSREPRTAAEPPRMFPPPFQ